MSYIRSTSNPENLAITSTVSGMCWLFPYEEGLTNIHYINEKDFYDLYKNFEYDNVNENKDIRIEINDKWDKYLITFKKENITREIYPVTLENIFSECKRVKEFSFLHRLKFLFNRNYK